MPTRVLVIPGYATSDRSTQLIRSALVLRGHVAHGWRLGRNEGPSEQSTAALAARLRELYERDSQPVALVGWSLGGLYSHWLARATPELVHSVTTLGSPLRRGDTPPPTLSVPTTSVYSRHDRIVPWRMSQLDVSSPRTENVEVRGSHLTLGVDPAVLYLINDRVGQDPRTWKPFRAPLPLRLAFPSSAA